MIGVLELAGEDLEVPAHLADLELAVLDCRSTGHELQVVDHDQPRPPYGP
jgi:hypothetical protein